MSQDDYPLLALIELRQNTLDQARQKLAEAQQELEEVQAREQDMAASIVEFERRQADEQSQTEEQLLRQGATIAELSLFGERREGLVIDRQLLEMRIEELVDQRKAAQRERDRRQEELTSAMAQLEAIESHHGSWQQEQESLREQIELDELEPLTVRNFYDCDT